MKRLFAALITVLMVGSAASCTPADSPSSEKSKAEDKSVSSRSSEKKMIPQRMRNHQSPNQSRSLFLLLMHQSCPLRQT